MSHPHVAPAHSGCRVNIRESELANDVMTPQEQRYHARNWEGEMIAPWRKPGWLRDDGQTGAGHGIQAGRRQTERRGVRALQAAPWDEARRRAWTGHTGPTAGSSPRHSGRFELLPVARFLGDPGPHTPVTVPTPVPPPGDTLSSLPIPATSRPLLGAPIPRSLLRYLHPHLLSVHPKRL